MRLMYTCACLYNTISIICSNYYFYSIPLNHQPPHQNFNQLAISILILVKTNNFINSMNGEGKLSTAKQTKCYSRFSISWWRRRFHKNWQHVPMLSSFFGRQSLILEQSKRTSMPSILCVCHDLALWSK